MAQRVSCPQCNKTFSKREHLNRHRLSHTGERPFQCQICSKPFSRRDVLLRHQRGHYELASSPSNATSARLNRKRAVRDELTEVSGYETSETVPSYAAAQQTDENIVRDQSRSSPLALSPSYQPESGLTNDLTVRPQLIAWDGGSTKMAPSLLATGLSPSQAQAGGRVGYSSYPTGDQALLPATDQVRLSAGRPSEFNRSPLMFSDIDSGTAFLDMLLGFPGGQATGTPSATATEELAIPWGDNGASNRLTISPPAEPGPRSYPSHVRQNVKKVQSFWSTPQRQTAETQIWYEIISGSSDNIFSSHDHESSIESSQETQHAGNAEICLNPEIRSRLQDLKRSLLKKQCHCPSSDGHVSDTCDEHYFCQNSLGIFEQGLYLYLDKYQPTYPILHIPTFKPQAVHTLLLFTMCMIGLSFVKTEEAVRFIYQIYPALLDEVYIRVISTAPGSSSPSAVLSQLTLAHHMLFLLVVTEGNVCPTKSQMLYGYTLTATQNLGLFHLPVGQISDALFSSITDDYIRWRSWSRIESIKNLIIGLLLYDSSLSGIFSMSPVISTSTLHVTLPCDFNLYRAPSAQDWVRLIQEGSTVATPTAKLSYNEAYLPILPRQVHISCLYGITSAILVRLLANYHRLIVSSDLGQEEWHQHIPWRIYNLDKRATSITNVVIHFIQLYDTILGNANPNCIVIWHNLCLLLTADIRLHERAAGREGPEAMQTARQAVTLWAKTPAARRACLHAAQIFHTLSNWKPMDGMGFQPARCLLNSALVLAMYTLINPPAPDNRHTETFDLATSDIDWKVVGEEGMTDSVPEQGEQPRTDHPAVNFIRFGGPIILCGKTYFGGARHARRLLLDFASLLDEVGRHWMAKYPRLLYMIHDTMVDMCADGDVRGATA